MGQSWKYAVAGLIAAGGVGAAAWQFTSMRDPNAETRPEGMRLGMGGGGKVELKGDPSQTPEQLKEDVAKRFGVDPSKVQIKDGKATVEAGDVPAGHLPTGALGLIGGGGAIEGPFDYKPVKGDGVSSASETLRQIVDEKARGDAKVGVAAPEVATAASDALLAFWKPIPKQEEGQEPPRGARLAAALQPILGDAEVDWSKAVVKVGEAKDLNSFNRRAGALMKMATSPAAMDPNLKGTGVHVRVPVKLKDPKTEDGEMELAVDLIKKDDGTWEPLAYSFSGTNEKAVRTLGKAAQSMRRAGGGS